MTKHERTKHVKNHFQKPYAYVPYLFVPIDNTHQAISSASEIHGGPCRPSLPTTAKKKQTPPPNHNSAHNHIRTVWDPMWSDTLPVQHSYPIPNILHTYTFIPAKKKKAINTMLPVSEHVRWYAVRQSCKMLMLFMAATLLHNNYLESKGHLFIYDQI